MIGLRGVGLCMDTCRHTVHTGRMTSKLNAGQQLDEIMRDLDKTTAAWRASGYGYDTPEAEAREAVFARLREWNKRNAR